MPLTSPSRWSSESASAVSPSGKAARSRFRSTPDRFTAAEFERYGPQFVPMPVKWANEDEPFLSALWKGAGVGGISILPMLVRLAQGDRRASVRMSREALARLGGCSPRAVDKARQYLEQQGLATSKYNGRGALIWDLRKLYWPKQANGRWAKDHFYYMPMSVVYGGSWSMMTAAQRQVFLVIALRARLYKEDLPARGVLETHYVADDVRDELDREDLQLALDLTYSEIARIAGLQRKTLEKVTPQWRFERLEREERQRAPILKLPTDLRDQSVYLLTQGDRLTPWPWAYLNRDLASDPPSPCIALMRERAAGGLVDAGIGADLDARQQLSLAPNTEEEDESDEAF